MTDWQGCYDGNWADLIVPEAFAHPAKFARGLAERIVQHGLDRGWFAPGDLIGDPFGGVGLGGVIAAYRGLRWVGVELEERFAKLAEENFALHAVRWENGHLPRPTILQGDSRQFAAIVGGCAGIVTSPPYAEGLGHCRAEHASNDAGRATVAPNAGKFSKSDLAGRDYGTTPGQIGQLKAGDLDAILTSPPYNLTMSQDHPGRAGGTRGTESPDGGFCRYGNSRGQIEGLPPGDLAAVITSPPYAETEITQRRGFKHANDEREPANRPTPERENGYGQTPGNIGNLPDRGFDGIVTSPPFENQSPSHDKAENYAGFQHVGTVKVGAVGYGYNEKNPDNIGQHTGDTYWQAVAEVYRQCLLALKPGGVLACVVKMYAKQGALVPLPDQTHDLLLHIGFEPLERVHALLVKETTTAGLFGDITTRMKRASFFRRLAEQAKAAAECWEGLAAYEQLSALAAVREELGVDADEKAVLRAAQKAALLAWEAEHGHWASEIDIDWEDVLFVRKPQ